AHSPEQPDFTAVGGPLVFPVALGEGLPVQLVQVGGFVGGEQRPLGVGFHAADELVRNPVGRVHVVGAAPVVAGVAAQFQEFFDVDVPGLQVGAHRAAAFSALVDRDRGVVGDLQERHHALGFAVGAVDVRSDAAHRCPVVAEATGVLGEHGVVADGVEDRGQVVFHSGQEAGGQLWPGGSGVEQGGGGAHEVEGGQQVVDLDRSFGRVVLAQREP